MSVSNPKFRDLLKGHEWDATQIDQDHEHDHEQDSELDVER